MLLNKKIIYVTGLPRSGSTLMCQLLGHHPQIYSTHHSSALCQTLDNLRRDLIILGENLPSPPVEDLILRLQAGHPDVKIILLCSAGFECNDTFGCMQKSDPPQVLLNLFRALRYETDRKI